MKFYKRLILATSLLLSPIQSLATQDVESFEDVLAYLRMLLVVPEISSEIVKLGEQGCRWEDQVIWGGSPSKEHLASGIFYKTLSMKFTNSSADHTWIQFAFSYKDDELLNVKNVTNQSEMLDCSN